MKRVVFRVDASLEMGSGHVMRCLNLADALSRGGGDYQVRFVCRDCLGYAVELIRRRGFELLLLPLHDEDAKPEPPPAYAAWLGVDRRVDASDCMVALQGGVDLLVVDHYGIDARWETVMRRVARRILVIDDLADREHNADLLLDQNLVARMDSRYTDLLPVRCRQMIGPEYALIDARFAEQPPVAPRSKVNRLFVFFGGSDLQNLTCRALRELAALGLPGDVVIGSGNPHRAEVEQLCDGSAWCLHVQTSRMAELMVQADLAVGAGGIAHWERCSVGLPAVVTAVAPNQVETTAMLAGRHACIDLGPGESLAPGAIAGAVKALCNDPVRLQSMSAHAHGVVPDAYGARRVVLAIEALWS